jgi:hypothetical protein
VTLDRHPHEVLATTTEWLRFTGLRIGLRPSLQTVVEAGFVVVPRQVSAVFARAGIDERRLDVGAHDVPLPIPVAPRTAVRLVVGRDGDAPAVAVDSTSEPVGGTRRSPVVALTSAQLFSETPIVISQEVLTEARPVGYPDVHPGSCLQIDLGRFDLAAGIEFDLPERFTVDRIAVVWTSGISATIGHATDLLDRLRATLDNHDRTACRLHTRRWPNDLLAGLVAPMIETLSAEVVTLTSPLVDPSPDVDDAVGRLRSLLDDLQRARRSLVRATEGGVHARRHALAEACDHLGRVLASARTSFAFTRELAPAGTLAPGAVPPGTYSSVLIPYSFRPVTIEVVSVLGSLTIVATTLVLMWWRLFGDPVGVDWDVAAGRIVEARNQIVTILVFLPTILFVLVPNMLVKAAPAERRANALFLTALAFGALAGPLLAVLTLGDPAPRLLAGGLAAAAAVQVLLTGLAWRKLHSANATARSRERRLDREVARLFRPHRAAVR